MAFSYDFQQLVIIAKPGPDQPYRQLATAFQSCLCGEKLLRPCLNVLRAFSDERHRDGILQELKFAADNQADETDWMLPVDRYYQANDRQDVDYRCPYIAGTLVSSMGQSCLDQKHRYYLCLLEAPLHTFRSASRSAQDPLYNKCGMGEGTVGVIDITDLCKIRYCFLNMDNDCVRCGLRKYRPGKFSYELEKYEMEEYTPSSGGSFTYELDLGLTVYRQERYIEPFEMLQAYPLIDVATLASCWPAAAWRSPEQSLANPTQVPSYRGVSQRGSKCLRQLAQDKLLDAVVLGLLDGPKLLDYPMRVRGFPKSFLATCAFRAAELSASENQEFIAEMLAILLESATHVDLYPFRQLPVGTIRQILGNERLNDTKSLNLSGLFPGPPVKIWSTLDTIPHQPEVVYILSPPNVGRAAEKSAIKSTIPHYVAGRKERFWDRVGSNRIIMGLALCTALESCTSSQRMIEKPKRERDDLNYLRELLRGDTMRLRLWP